jgi:hypothetical protein
VFSGDFSLLRVFIDAVVHLHRSSKRTAHRVFDRRGLRVGALGCAGSGELLAFQSIDVL